MGNPMVHFELMVSDLEKAKAFYRSVFDWKLDETSMPGYPLIDAGAPPEGGILLKPESSPACRLSTFFLVEDIDTTLAKATAAGATVAKPKTAITEIGYEAVFLDPDGTAVGLFQAV